MKEGTGKFFEVLAEMEGDDCLVLQERFSST